MSSTRRLVLLPAYILVFALAPACAPRVSKRAPLRPYSEPAPSALLAPKTVVHVAPIAPARAQVTAEPPAAAEAQPTLVVRKVEAPQPKAVAEEGGAAEEDSGYAPEPTAAKARSNFYAFTDTEISSL